MKAVAKFEVNKIYFTQVAEPVPCPVLFLSSDTVEYFHATPGTERGFDSPVRDGQPAL